MIQVYVKIERISTDFRFKIHRTLPENLKAYQLETSNIPYYKSELKKKFTEFVKLHTQKIIARLIYMNLKISETGMLPILNWELSTFINKITGE